ncbi:MAG: M56 family metallopeptidase, partial [Candidatus Paceibacterota bacterium]
LAYSQISVYAYELISKLQLTGIVKVVHNNKPYAFCSGLVKRHIYLSSGLVDLASSRELEAILRHEKHHLKNRDPLTRFLAHAAHALFPWFPVLGDLASRCRLDQEIKADKAAIQGLGSKKPLITVLKKLLVYDSCEVYPVISFYSQNLFEKRISALFNNKGYAYSITFSSSLVTLISLGFFIWVLFIPMSADVQSAQADTADCLKNQMCSINCLK